MQPIPVLATPSSPVNSNYLTKHSEATKSDLVSQEAVVAIDASLYQAPSAAYNANTKEALGNHETPPTIADSTANLQKPLVSQELSEVEQQQLILDNVARREQQQVQMQQYAQYYQQFHQMQQQQQTLQQQIVSSNFDSATVSSSRPTSLTTTNVHNSIASVTVPSPSVPISHTIADYHSNAHEVSQKYIQSQIATSGCDIYSEYIQNPYNFTLPQPAVTQHQTINEHINSANVYKSAANYFSSTIDPNTIPPGSEMLFGQL